jgi:hypothetical protein
MMRHAFGLAQHYCVTQDRSSRQADIIVDVMRIRAQLLDRFSGRAGKVVVMNAADAAGFIPK